VRIFETKTLAKFTRQHGISDDGLVDAVERAVRGLTDADLGGQIIKQGVERPGQGKRGGFRMIIGLRADRAIFLFAFAKNEHQNIDKPELMTLREIVASFLNAAEETIAQALKDGTLIEVQHGNESKKDKGENKRD
jgi:hypothetical protein